MTLLLPFLYGTFLGSFLNVCIFRLPRGVSVISPRSSCPVCKELIQWWQNIPILSYVLLKARCASCGSKISFRYPFIELLCGILLAFLWARDSGHLLNFAFHLVFVSLLVLITMIDWDYQIILDGTSYLGIAVGLTWSGLNHNLVQGILACGGAVLFFYAIRIVGEFVFLKEAMGEGDVKLAGMLGAFLGPKLVTIAILLSFPLGVVIAFTLILAGLKGRKDYIPFGPAMAAGGFLAAFWGQELLEWYIHFRFGL